MCTNISFKGSASTQSAFETIINENNRHMYICTYGKIKEHIGDDEVYLNGVINIRIE